MTDTIQKNPCCGACYIPAQKENAYHDGCANPHCPCHQKSVGEMKERQKRVHNHGTCACCDNLMRINEIALAQRERAVREQILAELLLANSLIGDARSLSVIKGVMTADELKALNNQPEV